MVKCASTALPPSATAAENLNASCGSRKSAECAGCGTGQASHASAAITRRPTRCQGFTDSIFVASPCNPAVKGGLRLTIGAGGGCPAAPGAVVQTYFFISSLDTASFDIASLDIASLDMASLDIPSLDIGSLDIASLDIASLDTASCAYTAEPAHTRQAVSRAVVSLFMDISQNGLRFKWQMCRISGAAERSAHTESVAATRSGFERAGRSHERRHSDAPTACSTCPVCIFWTKPTTPNSARFQFERSVTARSTSARPPLSAMGPIHSRTTWSCDKVTPLLSPAETREVILSSVSATNRASCAGEEDAVADAETDSFPEAVGSAWI